MCNVACNKDYPSPASRPHTTLGSQDDLMIIFSTSIQSIPSRKYQSISPAIVLSDKKLLIFEYRNNSGIRIIVSSNLFMWLLSNEYGLIIMSNVTVIHLEVFLSVNSVINVIQTAH